MELLIPWPVTPGNWLAFLSAAFAAALGLVLMLAPLGRINRNHHTASRTAHADSLAAGFSVGTGLSAILLDQPWLYLAVGAGWGFAAITSVIRIVCQRRRGAADLILALLQITLAILPLAYVFGHLP